MGKGGCVHGQLVTTLYTAPIPLIGLYIGAGTLVCLFCMTFDLVHGFIRRKPFVPCKLFSMNAFSMTMLAIATKIPVDLTTSMPRAEDQLSKLMSTALMCTSLGFYMPSLGTMGTSERYGNLAALSVMVITMIVNVCIQMGTGVIFAFTVEHIIIMVCILVLLLLMWSSAIAFRGQKEVFKNIYKYVMSIDSDKAKGLQGLKKLLVKLHILNYTGNPQTLLCETSHHQTFGLLSVLSSAIVLEAMLRSFALKNIRSCGSDVSDYKWSIHIVIVAQFLTIVVGNFSITFRWFSFASHTDRNEVLNAHKKGTYFPGRELEYLKLKTFSFMFHGKNLSKVFLVTKDFIMDVLIRMQIMLYTCSSIFFIGFPIYIVKTFLKRIIPFVSIFHEHTTEDVEEILLKEMSISVLKLRDYVLSSLKSRGAFETWIKRMALKDLMRWTNTYKRDPPTHLIQLMSKCQPPAAFKSECAFFIRKLEATGKEFLGIYGESFEYRVSFVSVLVLSVMLVELMPSSRMESLMHNFEALDESFEIIYYIDQKTTNTPSREDERRWTLINDVWAQWRNPNHWFRTKIIQPAFKSCSFQKSNVSELDLNHVLGVLRDALPDREEIDRTLTRYFYGATEEISTTLPHYFFGDHSLAERHMAMISIEFSIICKFILEQNNESIKDLLDFFEICFVEMLRFTLRRLPLAIVKEVHGDYPSEIGEERVRKALMFFCKLELLEEGDTKIEWSWPAEFEPERHQANDAHSLVQVEPNQTSSSTTTTTTTTTTTVGAHGCDSSEIVATIVAPNCDASLATVATAAHATDDDDDDRIIEIGSTY